MNLEEQIEFLKTLKENEAIFAAVLDNEVVGYGTVVIYN